MEVFNVSNAQVNLTHTAESGNVYIMSVNVVNNKVNGVSNGKISNAEGVNIATFSYYTNGGLNINYTSMEYIGIDVEVKGVCEAVAASNIVVSATIE